MTVEKKLRPTSPVHVHVDDDIPVHVHVKKTKTKKSKLVPSKKRSSSALGVKGTSNSLRPKSAAARARSRSPGGGPWIPPPGKTTRGSKIGWQGPPHHIDIPTASCDGPVADLSTDEEDRIHGTMRNYEKKIDNLMSEVGTLKNESSSESSGTRPAKTSYARASDACGSKTFNLPPARTSTPAALQRDIDILVDLQKALHEIEKRDDLLDTSQRVIQSYL